MTMKNKISALALISGAMMGGMGSPSNRNLKSNTDDFIRQCRKEIDAELERNLENHRKFVEQSKLEHAERKRKNELRAKNTDKIKAAIKRKKTKQHGKLIKNV